MPQSPIASDKAHQAVRTRDAASYAALPCPFRLLETIGAEPSGDCDLRRLLPGVARRLRGEGGFARARLMMTVTAPRLAPASRFQFGAAAVLMMAGALRRLQSVATPELLVLVKEATGELQLSMIDNSRVEVSAQEAALISRVILPLGGVHDCERSGPLIESAFSFLICAKHRLAFHRGL